MHREFRSVAFDRTLTGRVELELFLAGHIGQEPAADSRRANSRLKFSFASFILRETSAHLSPRAESRARKNIERTAANSSFALETSLTAVAGVS